MIGRKRTADFIVVGAGAMGAATAYQLKKLGAGSVIMLDAFGPGHKNGSSHGKTRVTRLLAVEGRIYATLARRSLEIWKELDDAGYGATNQPLFSRNGFLVISDPDSDDTRLGAQMKQDALDWQQEGEAIEELDEAQIRARFPQFRIRDGSTGALDPTGGVLAPERCILAQRGAGLALGVDIQDEVRMTGWSSNGSVISINTTEGSYEAAKVVFAMGARIPETLNGFFEERLEVADQIHHWFQPTDPSLWSGPDVPTFAWFGKGRMFYGIPPILDPSGRVKAATEQWALNCAPDDVTRDVSMEEKKAFFEEYVRDHLALIDDPAVEAIRCLYTGRRLRDDTDRNINFLIDRHPDNENAVFISACSGHGFKHSAAIGERVAAFLLDRGDLPTEFLTQRPQPPLSPRIGFPDGAEAEPTIHRR